MLQSVPEAWLHSLCIQLMNETCPFKLSTYFQTDLHDAWYCLYGFHARSCTCHDPGVHSPCESCPLLSPLIHHETGPNLASEPEILNTNEIQNFNIIHRLKHYMLKFCLESKFSRIATLTFKTKTKSNGARIIPPNYKINYICTQLDTTIYLLH